MGEVQSREEELPFAKHLDTWSMSNQCPNSYLISFLYLWPSQCLE